MKNFIITGTYKVQVSKEIEANNLDEAWDKAEKMFREGQASDFDWEGEEFETHSEEVDEIKEY